MTEKCGTFQDDFHEGSNLRRLKTVNLGQGVTILLLPLQTLR